jgi:hypothetical protein
LHHISLLIDQIIQNLKTNRFYNVRRGAILFNSLWIARQLNLFLLETLSARADVGISVKKNSPEVFHARPI